jgi:hypothetical protein
MHAKPLPAAPTLSPACGGAGIGVILRNLAALIARRFLHHPLRAALIIPLWQHLTRAALRLDRLLVRLAAGPLPPPRPRAGNHSGARRKSAFPTTSAWLIRTLGAEAAIYAAQLEALLAAPEAADLLACTAARRTLAPIRRMLGLPPAQPSRPVTPACVTPASALPPSPAPPRKTPPRPDPIPSHRTIDPPPRRPRRPWWLPPPGLRSG